MLTTPPSILKSLLFNVIIAVFFVFKNKLYNLLFSLINSINKTVETLDWLNRVSVAPDLSRGLLIAYTKDNRFNGLSQSMSLTS